MNKYDAYYKNIYSQFGEDGIIQYLIDKLHIKTNGESCEVGMIGTNWSNTFNLAENYKWKSIFIDKDERHLVKIPKLKNISIINSEIEDNLDEILENENLSKDFDILSIDTDGMNYTIWDNLKKFRPKIVIIEQDLKSKNKNINSFISVVKLAESKNYSFFMKGVVSFFFISDEVIDNTGFNQCEMKQFYLEKKII
jgi:hypothetical protein